LFAKEKNSLQATGKQIANLSADGNIVVLMAGSKT